MRLNLIFRTKLYCFVFFAIACLETACSGINDSWEVKGGGFFKYSINDGDEHTIELSKRDVEIPFIKNSHHYFLLKTQISESSTGDQFNVMVNRPIVLGDNPIVESYSWFSFASTAKTSILSDSSYVHFDEKNDSTWTAYLYLQTLDCRSGKCDANLPRLHIKGRLRYWTPEDWR